MPRVVCHGGAHGDRYAYAVRWRYYRHVALRAGVPFADADDAAQDIAIRIWRAGDPPFWRLVAKRAAVEAARRYGPRGRRNTRPRMVPIHEAHWVNYDETAIRDRLLDVELAWSGLTLKQRQAMRKWCRDERMTDAERMAAVNGRRKLQRLCA